VNESGDGEKCLGGHRTGLFIRAKAWDGTKQLLDHNLQWNWDLLKELASNQIGFLFSFTSLGRLPTNSIQVSSGHTRGEEVQGSDRRAQAGCSFPFHLFFLSDQQLRLVFLFWIIIRFCITTFQCTTLIFYPTKLHPKHHELGTVASGTITLPLQIAAPVLDLSGRERTCSVSGEGVTPHIFLIYIVLLFLPLY
jgi:hypothetical protein